MPRYEVTHVAPLTPAQQEALALAITEIHSKRFTTPRLFVNVTFADATKTPTYVGGRPRQINSILATIRRGPTRTQSDFDALCGELRAAWVRIVGGDDDKQRELRAIWVTGEILTAWEAGFAVPLAGHDREWARDNLDAFRRLAGEGDEDFVDLVRELETREDFQ